MSSRSSCTSETRAVSASTSISSGHLTTISSALGTRSRVASPARGSTTTVRQPSGFASAQSASAMSPAPTATRRGGGGAAPAEEAPAHLVWGGSLAGPPPAGLVACDDDVARAALDRRCAGERLDEDVDLPPAREADAPGFVVGDPVGDALRRSARQHGLRAFGNVC